MHPSGEQLLLAMCVALLCAIAGGRSAVGADSVALAQNNIETNDPFLWLEDIHGAQATNWVKAQNARSISQLEKSADYRTFYKVILKEFVNQNNIPVGNLDHNYFFQFGQDDVNLKGVWARTTISDFMHANRRWETLLDVDRLAMLENENWVWEGADTAPGLKHCLISLSRGGGDAAVVREFDLATETFMKAGFILPEAKSDITYLDDDSVLVSTDFGPGSTTTSGRSRIVKLWKRGQPLTAAKTVFEGNVDDEDDYGLVFYGPAGTIALIRRDLTHFTSEYYYVTPDNPVLKLPLPQGADLKDAQNGNLIFTVRNDWTSPDGKSIAKGSLVAFPVMPFVKNQLPPKFTVLYAPDATSTVNDVAATRDAVYASIYSNVTGSIHVFRSQTNSVWSDRKLDLPGYGSTDIVSANSWEPEVQVTFQSFTQPEVLYTYVGGDKPKAVRSQHARFKSANLVTQQFFATSKDGTRIPYFVTRQKTLTTPRPTILCGYGGFEVSLTPNYDATYGRLWLNKGGVLVSANIRGGGEFGPAWHQAAVQAKRQNAYDDFQAVGKDLVQRGLTTPKQLGIMGDSNGGLLVSACMVERPDLFGAVVCEVPLIDMLRYTQLGQGASWIAEYGDPADPKAREYILKYSPYQNVSAHQTYPPVFFVTATSDDRVTPAHARKMAARMEAQGHDVLFYENTDGGHAASADDKQAAKISALSLVFFKQKLGL